MPSVESIYPFAEVNALVLEGDSEDYQEKVLINNETVIVLDAKPGKLVLDVLESYKEWRLLSKPEENIQYKTKLWVYTTTMKVEDSIKQTNKHRRIKKKKSTEINRKNERN